jgi:hypothetical protein
MICLLTSDYRIAFANRSYREHFNVFCGLYCYKSRFEFTNQCEFCESYKVLETGKPHHWESNGPDSKVIDVYDFPFTDVDGLLMILKMDVDITERKQMEKELESISLLPKENLNPVIRLNQGRKISFINTAAQIMLTDCGCATNQ